MWIYDQMLVRPLSALINVGNSNFKRRALKYLFIVVKVESLFAFPLK